MAILAAFSSRILWWLGAILTSGEPPRKADIVVTLGGDYDGNRILAAAELVREGYAPKVSKRFGHDLRASRGDLAIELAVERGYPGDEFIAYRYPALSTKDEARADIEELRRLGVHSYLLVTSVYHTARAGRIFRREGAGLEEHTVSAPDRYWENGQWWTNREGRKLWFFETVKTVADYLGSDACAGLLGGLRVYAPGGGLSIRASSS